MGTWFEVFLALHLICAVGGFGYLAYSGLTLMVGRRRGAALGTLEVTLQVSGLAEGLLYGVLIFGVAAVLASSKFGFGDAWVGIGFGLYIIELGILHGAIKRPQREYAALARDLVAGTGPGGDGPPAPVRQADASRIQSLEQRIAGAWGAFNLIAVAAIFIMVFKPGS